MDTDLSNYSAEPFTPNEWRAMRRNLVMMEQERTAIAEDRVRMGPVIRAFETGSTIGRAIMVILAWVAGIGVPIMGVAFSLSQLHWWPFGEGP